MFSSRVPGGRSLNRLARARAAIDARGGHVVDLTESNPTRVGLPYPADLLDALADRRGLVYTPSARGLAGARRAVAAFVSRTRTMHPDRVVLTASTSEAYAGLFKALCDPGDEVLVPQPSYPLLDYLARFEGVVPIPYPLRYVGRWELDVAALQAAAGPRTRAVVAVSPNNPTGSRLSRPDHDALRALCRSRGCALIADEVFGAYVLDETAPRSVLDEAADVLTFCLGGLSKAVGLPQVKLGWIVVDGPPRDVAAALARLDMVFDTYLSVSTPVQLGAAALLDRGAAVAARIRDRLVGNLATLARLVASYPSVDLLSVEGGWSAVLRVPALVSEERLLLDLLERDRVQAHPGYFFDFPHEAFVVTSLLPAPDRFGPAVTRLLDRATAPERTPSG